MSRYNAISFSILDAGMPATPKSSAHYWPSLQPDLRQYLRILLLRYTSEFGRSVDVPMTLDACASEICGALNLNSGIISRSVLKGFLVDGRKTNNAALNHIKTFLQSKYPDEDFDDHSRNGGPTYSAVVMMGHALTTSHALHVNNPAWTGNTLSLKSSDAAYGDTAIKLSRQNRSGKQLIYSAEVVFQLRVASDVDVIEPAYATTTTIFKGDMLCHNSGMTGVLFENLEKIILFMNMHVQNSDDKKDALVNIVQIQGRNFPLLTGAIEFTI